MQLADVERAMYLIQILTVVSVAAYQLVTSHHLVKSAIQKSPYLLTYHYAYAV